MLAGSLRRFAKLNIFSITNAVSRRENSVEADFLRICDCFQVIRRIGWFAAGEEDNDLALWLERNSAIENCFRIFKRGLVDITNLVRIHEARVAHHVATVRQINCQHRPASKLYVRSSVTMNCGIFCCAEITAKEE